MDTHVVSKSSLQSAAMAVSEAIAVALSAYGHDAKNVHVIVDSIESLGNEWKAVIRVLVQPDLEEELEKLLIKENIIDQETLERHEKQRKHERDIEMAILDDSLDLEEALEMNEIIVFAYFPAAYEDVYYQYDTIKPDHYHAHLIQSPDTWKHVEDFFPDLDFYHATHPVEPKPKIDDTKPPKFDREVRSPDHRRTHGYSDLELKPHLE